MVRGVEGKNISDWVWACRMKDKKHFSEKTTRAFWADTTCFYTARTHARARLGGTHTKHTLFLTNEKKKLGPA